MAKLLRFPPPKGLHSLNHARQELALAREAYYSALDATEGRDRQVLEQDNQFMAVFRSARERLHEAQDFYNCTRAAVSMRKF